MKAFKLCKIAALLLVSNAAIYANHIETLNIPGQDTIVGEKKDFVKDFNKTFNVGKEDLVVLANKYGKIDVKTGTGNQVVVNVRVTVRSNSQGEADKMFDRVNIAFSNGPGFVKSETLIETQSNNVWNWNWSGNSVDFSIDYDVTMPAVNKLDLTNKYGSSHVGALSSWVKIDQKYGNFSLESAGSATVTLAYGDGNIRRLNGLNGSIAYGSLVLPDAKDVQLRSKYSKFRFDKIGSLDIVSAYDDYDVNDVKSLKVDGKYGDLFFGNVDNIVATTNYTDLKIKKLEESADLQTNYGSVRFDGLKAGFNGINIKSTYTDYVILADPSVGYQIDASMSYGDVSKPTTLKTKYDAEKGASKTIVGYVGSNANVKSFIKARMNYGDLKLR